MARAVSRSSISARPSHCGSCGRCARGRRWTKPEDALVDSLLGTHEAEEIAATLTAHFGTFRTPGARARPGQATPAVALDGGAESSRTRTDFWRGPSNHPPRVG